MGARARPGPQPVGQQPAPSGQRPSRPGPGPMSGDGPARQPERRGRGRSDQRPGAAGVSPPRGWPRLREWICPFAPRTYRSRPTRWSAPTAPGRWRRPPPAGPSQRRAGLRHKEPIRCPACPPRTPTRSQPPTPRPTRPSAPAGAGWPPARWRPQRRPAATPSRGRQSGPTRPPRHGKPLVPEAR